MSQQEILVNLSLNFKPISEFSIAVNNSGNIYSLPHKTEIVMY